jgi:hypothetical protein
MLDNPEKTASLLAALKAATPFEVELPPALVNYLKSEDIAVGNWLRQTVSDVSYAGEEGGIVCHLSRSDETGQALIVSLTHLRMPRRSPFAAAVTSYQRHRVKKIKRQGAA